MLTLTHTHTHTQAHTLTHLSDGQAVKHTQSTHLTLSQSNLRLLTMLKTNYKLLNTNYKLLNTTITAAVSPMILSVCQPTRHKLCRLRGCSLKGTLGEGRGQWWWPFLRWNEVIHPRFHVEKLWKTLKDQNIKKKKKQFFYENVYTRSWHSASYL